MHVHTRDNMSFDAVYEALMAGEIGDYTEEQVRDWADAVADALYERGYIEFDERTANYYYTEEAETDEFAENVFWPTVEEYDDPAKWEE